MSTPQELALNAAKESKCRKRKVGAVIADANDYILAVACNHSPHDDRQCEDARGATFADVVHAEVAAINQMVERFKDKDGEVIIEGPITIYTTHAPCANCRAAIEEADIEHIVVVNTFMKFDCDKLRYDLIPPEWHEGDAEILTFGAKKYKPNNWKKVDDIGRYLAALERHLTAYKKGWLYDPETGLHHMKHLRTNAGFLLTLTEEKKDED